MLINQIFATQFIEKNRSLDPQVYMLKILNVKTQTRSMYKKGRYLKMKSKRKELKIVMSNIERDNFLQTKLEKIHNSRIITSLYFDTEDFYLYKQSKNTDVDKFKIRFRKYSNSKTIFKEFKFNHFDSKYKEVQETEFNSLEEIKCLFYKSYKLIPSIYVSYERDYYFYTSVNVWGEDWDDYGYCGFDIEWLGLSVQSDDNRIWYPMDCDGSLEGYSFYFLKNGQSITYATDYDSQIDNVDVSGDIDPDLDGILIDFLPFIIPIAYLGMIIWSFVKKKKSLGLGLIGGIFVAPFSFCFIMFMSVLFWDL